MKIKKLIELAEKATQGEWFEDDGCIHVGSIPEKTDLGVFERGHGFDCFDCHPTAPGSQYSYPGSNVDVDAEYIAAACPANLIPILKCAERMSEALRCARENADIAPTATSKWAREVLEEWDSLNAEP